MQDSIELISVQEISEDDVLDFLNSRPGDKVVHYESVSTQDDSTNTHPDIPQPVNVPDPVRSAESANAKNANPSLSDQILGCLVLSFGVLCLWLVISWIGNIATDEGIGSGRGNHNDALFDADQAAEEAMQQIMSTPEGRDAVEVTGNKDVQLTRFQQAHGISDRIAEAAIKEWVLSHNGNFDWNLNEVKAICLRMK